MEGMRMMQVKLNNPTVSSPLWFGEINESHVVNFYEKLKSSGIHVTIRSQFGIDIDASCGQLYGNYQRSKAIIW